MNSISSNSTHVPGTPIFDPAHDPIVIANQYILLPTYCIGIVLNGTILLAILVKWRSATSLLIRIEKVAAVLVLVCFLWSADSAVRYALPKVTTNSDNSRRIQGFLASGFILLLQGLNVSFAIERFLTVKRWKGAWIVRAIGWQWVTVVIFLATDAWSFIATKEVDSALTPDYDYIRVWMLIMGLAFISTLIATVTLNSLTYRTCFKELKLALENVPTTSTRSTTPSFSLSATTSSNSSSTFSSSSSSATVTNSLSLQRSSNEEDGINNTNNKNNNTQNSPQLQFHQPKKSLLLARINKRMIFRCVIMNATLLICQTPLIVLNLMGTFIMDDFAAAVCTAVGFAFMASEAVVTPLLVLYFFPRVRSLLFGEERQVVEVDEENSDETEGGGMKENVETPVAAAADAPKFHIIRIVV
ncbi:hypothetical protein CcCBS67573_g05366 [Chytriomyces confervae]|uniref:G-protein coupled receptors family 1 profile domain-containing protein n=1 Tax=Chytriomyces confervae TaxID=246404 RepID=A0A507FAN2_9FUNG|nr:hypothetical protein HDU80_004211 [Chytriomyces hyalinus]TPX73379.1 hypothetical protein CcCBS67573_g05366 [Chytriomyces confervae]